MARKHFELFAVARGVALANAGTYRFSREFPMGEIWRRLLLHFHHDVTIGTGTGALTDGLLRWIKGLRLQTGKGDIIVDSVPGRPLYWLDAIKSGTLPPMTVLAAVDGTYDALVSIWFADPLALRPEDTLLETDRLTESGVTLEVTGGSEADLFSSPGTATDAVTVDVYIERQRGRIEDPKAKPLVAPYYGIRPPQVPSAVAALELDRALNLFYKRVILFGSVSATNGTPFSGNADNGVFSLVKLVAEYGEIYKDVLPALLNAKNKVEYQLETAIAGLSIFDLVKDGSMGSQLASGQQSRLAIEWTFGAGATPQASVAVEGTRPLIA